MKPSGVRAGERNSRTRTTSLSGHCGAGRKATTLAKTGRPSTTSLAFTRFSAATHMRAAYAQNSTCDRLGPTRNVQATRPPTSSLPASSWAASHARKLGVRHSSSGTSRWPAMRAAPGPMRSKTRPTVLARVSAVGNFSWSVSVWRRRTCTA